MLDIAALILNNEKTNNWSDVSDNTEPSILITIDVEQTKEEIY